jgi:hypothetical protein
MQAIATLHAQLNLATEKLDHAQKALTGSICLNLFKCHSKPLWKFTFNCIHLN